MELKSIEKWCDVEKKEETIAIFKKILDRKNQIHVKDLFIYLDSVIDNKIQMSFLTLNTLQKIEFFRKRQNVFVVQGYFVSKFRKSNLSLITAIKKFYSATHFILQCYQPLHFLEIKKLITFLFEDVARYIMILSSERENELMKNIGNVNIDDHGILTLINPLKICTQHISSEEKCLIVIVFYLNLHGRTYFKKLLQKLKKLAQKESSIIFSDRSESEHLIWLKKFEDFLKIYEDGFLELRDEYSSYECDYQKLSYKQFSVHHTPPQEYDLVNNMISSSNDLLKTKEILVNINGMNIQKDENITFVNKKFYCAVLFLLSCFDPMHYLELKECITFTMKDIGKILRKIPFGNLQEVFQKIPFTIMNEDGFLQISELCQVEKNVSNEEMIKLFTVYYLGYCGKTHVKKLVQELVKRAPEPVSFVISALPVSKQVEFFKKFTQFFQIKGDRYLKVNSSFNLPYCEYHELGKSNSMNNNSSIRDNSNITESIKQTLNFKNKPFGGNAVNLRVPFGENSAIIKKISCSIAYLLKFFELKVSIKLFSVILHVLDNSRIHFLNLSALHQTDIVKKAILPFTINEKNISSTFSQLDVDYLTEKEMELLFFAYHFSQCGEMHFRKAIDVYHKKNGKNPIGVCSDSEKYWYFKKSKSIFNLDIYSYVKLCSLPVLKLQADFLSHVIKDGEKVLNSNDSDCSLKYHKQHNLNDTNQNSSKITSVQGSTSLKNIDIENKSDKSENFSASVFNGFKTNISFINDKRYKTLCEAVCFLLYHFNSLHFTCLKKIISNIYGSVGSFLNQLSESDQDEIFKNIPCTEMDKNGFLLLIEINEFNSLSNTKNRLLFIICYLVLNGTTHYTSIIKILEHSGLWSDTLALDYPRGFFQSYKKFMKMSNKGSLTPSDMFTFSTCDNLIFHSNKELLHSNVKKKIPLQISKKYQTSETHTQRQSEGRDNCEISTSSSELVKIYQKGYNSQIEKIQKQECYDSEITEFIEDYLSCYDSVSKNKMFVKLENPVIRKIQEGIFFLLQHFCLEVSSKFLNVLILVLDETEFFTDLATTDEVFIFKYILLPFKMNKKYLTSISLERHHNSLCETEKEKLLMAFIIAEQKELHFEKIFKECLKYNLVVPSSMYTTKRKFNFFKEMSKIFVIGNDGYVTLAKLPSIKSNLNTLLKCFFADTVDSGISVLSNNYKSISLKDDVPFCISSSNTITTENFAENALYYQEICSMRNEDLKECAQLDANIPSVTFSDISFSTCDNLIFDTNKELLQSNGEKKIPLQNCKEHQSPEISTRSHIPSSTNTIETENIYGTRDDKLAEKEQNKVNYEKISYVKTKNFDRSVQYNNCLLPSLNITKTDEKVYRIMTKSKQDRSSISKETKTASQLDVNKIFAKEENLTSKIGFIKGEMESLKNTNSGDNKLNKCVISSTNVLKTQDIHKNKHVEMKEGNCTKTPAMLCISLPISSKELAISSKDTLNKSNNAQNCSNEHVLEKNWLLKHSDQKICSKLVNGISFLVEFFNAIVDHDLLLLVLQVVNKGQFKFLFLPESSEAKILLKVFQCFASPLKKADVEKLLKGRDVLSEEVENILFMAYLIFREKKLHYEKLCKKFIDYNKKLPAYMETASEALKYIRSLDYLFLIKTDYVGLQLFKIVELGLKNCFKISNFNHVEENIDKSTTTYQVEKIPEKKLHTVINSSSVSNCTKTFLKNNPYSDYEKNDYFFKKIQAGVIFFLQHCHLKAEVVLLEILLHALDENKFFINLPTKDQAEFMKKCFNIFSINQESVILPSVPSMPDVKLKNEEKTLLAVIFVLLENKKLHYRSIFKKLVNQVPIPSTDKAKSQYFKTRNDHFKLENTGYVSLKNLPVIQLNDDQFRDLFQISVIDSVDKYPNHETPNTKPNLQNKFGASIRNNNPKIQCEKDQIVKDDTSKKEEMNKPFKKIIDGVIFLLNYFKLDFEPYLICVLLHALEDAKNYFLSLQVSDQNKFVQKSLSFFDNNCKCLPSNGVSYPTLCLNNNEKDVLFLVYILSHEKEMHCLKVFDMYTLCDRSKPVALATHVDLYKYFSKRKNLFTLDSNGCVKLKKQFTVGQNSVVLSVSCISPHAVPRNLSASNSTSNQGTGIISQLQNNRMLITDNLILDENFKHSNNFQTIYRCIKESSIFLYDSFKFYPHEHFVRTILHILNQNENFCSKDCQKVFFNFDINMKNYNSSKYHLSEEEKDLLIFTCTLMHLGPLHYSILFKQLKTQNRNSWKSLVHTDQYKYVLERPNYFLISGDGIVSLSDIPCIKGVDSKNFIPGSETVTNLNSEYYLEKNDTYYDELIDLCIEKMDKNINKFEGLSKFNALQKPVSLNSGCHLEESDTYYDELIDLCIEKMDKNINIFEGLSKFDTLQKPVSLNSGCYLEKNDTYYDELIDLCIEKMDKKVNKSEELSKFDTLKKSVYNSLKIIAEKESNNLNTAPATYGAPIDCNFPNNSKTKSELKCVNFFSIILHNVEMAASPHKYFHLASEEVQNHIKDSYGGNIDLFLHIHDMFGASSFNSVEHFE
ncbi:uncharacterized protein NPIL_415381 [Nephila pilipes]|uniref:Uncharacterized protein n=1 Tax=Nephila pilipes TaxID=299642 RepID=A0A8X6NN62_NEPPI|nr:uncharacterized protein NPIL_415381 [Nephila pilipes]